MGSVVSIELVRLARQSILLSEVMRFERGQVRAARLDGRSVVVLGFVSKDEDYVPVFLFVDPGLEPRLVDVRTLPGVLTGPRQNHPVVPADPLAPVPSDWCRMQFSRVLEALEFLDTPVGGDCRYATLDGDEVVVFGGCRAGGGIDPRLVIIDYRLMRRINDIRVFDVDRGQGWIGAEAAPEL